MRVEVFLEGHELAPLFTANFDVVPRIGETVSVEADDYFTYYEVTTVWHRGTGEGANFQSCIEVRLND